MALFSDEWGSTGQHSVFNSVAADVLDTDESVGTVLESDTYAEALQAANEALARFDGSGQDKNIAAALNTVARVHLGNQRPQEACQVARDALAHCRINDDSEGQAVALCTLAKARLQIPEEKPGVALGDCEQALDLLRASPSRVSGPEGAKVEASVLRAVARAHLDRLRKNVNEGPDDEAMAQWSRKEAVRASDEATALARQMGDEAVEVQALLCGAEVRLAVGDVEEAGRSAEIAADMARSLGDHRAEAQAKYAAAVALWSNRNAAKGEGLRLAEEALKLFRAAGDVRGQATTLISMAVAQLNAGDHIEAQQMAGDGVRFYRELGDQRREAVAQRMLASAYLHIADVSHVHGSQQFHSTNAALAAEEAVTLFRDMEDERGEASALPLLAEAQLQEELTYASMETAERMQELAAKLKDRSLEATAKITMARARFFEDNPPADHVQKAMSAGREAQKILKATGDSERARQVGNLCQYFRKESTAMKRRAKAAAAGEGEEAEDALAKGVKGRSNGVLRANGKPGSGGGVAAPTKISEAILADMLAFAPDLDECRLPEYPI